MEIIYIYGAQAVGKRTIARELRKLSGYNVVDNHIHTSLALQLYSSGSKGYIALREKIRDAIFTTAKKLGDSGLILTGVNEAPREKYVKETIKYFKKLNSKIKFIHLVCSEEERKRRIATPDRKDKPTNKVKQLRPNKIFHKIEGIEHPTIDVTDMSPKKAARQIMKMIKI